MNALCDAIRHRRVVAFVYDGNRRVVEPHMVSVYRDGDVMLHAWQRCGGSGTDWRDFEVAKIERLAITEWTFRKPHSGYHPSAKPYVRIVCRLEPVE